MVFGCVFDGEGCASAAVEDFADDPGGEDEDEQADGGEDEAHVAVEGVGEGVDEGGAVEDGDDGPEEEADEFSGGDGEEEGDGLHFKDAGGELEELDGHGRGHHGGDHDGEELLFFEAVAEFFVALAVDAFEQEELSAGAADVVGEQRADGGADGGEEDVEEEAAVIVGDEVDDEGVDGDGDGGGVDDGERADAPDAERLQEGEHGEVEFAEEGDGAAAHLGGAPIG